MRPSTLSNAAFLAGLARAQNDTNSTNTTECRDQWAVDSLSSGTVNATGREAFTWNSTSVHDSKATRPWYISVLVNDTLRGREGDTSRNNGGTIAWPYLSVPEEVHDANLCVYQFASQNATSTGTNCGGILSDECTAYLRESLQNATDGIHRTPPRCRLPPNTDADLRRREEACGSLGGPALRAFEDIGNRTCSLPLPPSVDIPDDYITHGIGVSLSAFNASPGARWENYSDMAYDLHLVQSTPFAVVSGFNFDNTVEKDVQFVCVTPNQTLPGSRVPENREPWEETSGAGRSWSAAVGGRWGVLGAGVVGLVLAW